MWVANVLEMWDVGCGICNLRIMACRCATWDVGYVLQIYRRWGLGGRQFAFNGIPCLASCHNVLLMPWIWLKKDVEGAEWSSHVSILAATRYPEADYNYLLF